MEFLDQTFWVGVSFIIIVGLLAKPVGKIVIAALDNRSNRIQQDLDEALRLKEEAQALLASYQRKQKEAIAEAAHIVEFATAEAKRIVEDSSANLEESLNKRIEMSMQKIAAHEQQILNSIKEKAIHQAMQAAKQLIAENSSEKDSEKLIKQALDNLSEKMA